MSQTMNQTMNQTPHQVLHQDLLLLHGRAKAWLEGKNSKRFDPAFGICAGLWAYPYYHAQLRELLASWPGGSGSEDYPVPHPTKAPLDAFYECGAQEMWNPEFEYARNRWALLEWLIEQTAPQFPYVAVRDPGTINEVEIGTFATFLEAVAFANKNRDGHDVDVMKRQPGGSLTTEF